MVACLPCPFKHFSLDTSMEGTTQGDPLAMPMYALGVDALSDDFVKQVWYADDASTCG